MRRQACIRSPSGLIARLLIEAWMIRSRRAARPPIGSSSRRRASSWEEDRVRSARTTFEAPCVREYSLPQTVREVTRPRGTLLPRECAQDDDGRGHCRPRSKSSYRATRSRPMQQSPPMRPPGTRTSKTDSTEGRRRSPSGHGSRSVPAYWAAGSRYTYEIRELLEGERLVSEHRRRPLPEMETTYTWTDTTNGGTSMTLRIVGGARRASRRSRRRVMASAMSHANRKDLARLKELLET